jgi:general secretion pathway protein F
MPVFEYSGYDARGAPKKGVLDADHVKALRVHLKREGIIATKVKEQGSTSVTGGNKAVQERLTQFNRLLERVSAEQLGLATRQLAVLLGAGVPMVDSLTALVEQTESPLLQRVLSDIKSDVNEGSSMADAMAKHKVFDRVFVNMVRAGESSGTLDVVLERLADFKEGQAKLTSEVIGALMYPAIMVLVGIGNITLMFTVVVPKITKIFEHAKVQLPLTTRILMFVSSTISNWWWLILLLMIGAFFLFRRWVNSEDGRRTFDSFKLRIPFFGELVRMIAMARFSRTLGTLLSAGVPLLSSLEIVRNVVANDRLAKAVDMTREAVREGEDIAIPLKRAKEFPPMLVHMVAIGEKSGQLEQMLNRVAITYEQRADTKMKGAMSLLSPLLILAMGGTVGFIVFAILTPIMQMNSMVK